MYFLQPHWLRHVAGTDQHQGGKFVVPSLCGADVEVHQAVKQGGKRYIAHIVQTWYEANKNKGIIFRMQDRGRIREKRRALGVVLSNRLIKTFLFPAVLEMSMH